MIMGTTRHCSVYISVAACFCLVSGCEADRKAYVPSSVSIPDSSPDVRPPSPVTASGCDSGAPVKSSDNNALPGGTWQGTIASCLTLKTYPAHALVTEDGRFMIDSEGYFLHGALNTDGDTFVGDGHAILASSEHPTLGDPSLAWVEGWIGERGYLDGHWRTALGDFGVFTLSYSESTHTLSSAIETLEGPSWLSPDGDFGWTHLWPPLGGTWAVSAEGQVSAEDSAGCIYSGLVSVIDAHYNIYDVTLTVLECAAAGTFSGFAEWVPQPEGSSWFPVDLHMFLDDGAKQVLRIRLLGG